MNDSLIDVSGLVTVLMMSYWLIDVSGVSNCDDGDLLIDWLVDVSGVLTVTILSYLLICGCIRSSIVLGFWLIYVSGVLWWRYWAIDCLVDVSGVLGWRYWAIDWLVDVSGVLWGW